MVEGKPTVSRIMVIVGAVLAVVAAGVAVALWAISGSAASVVTARMLSVVLVTPLLMLVGSKVVNRSVGPSELLSGWANPQIELSPWPARLGTTVTVTYRRRPIARRATKQMASAPGLESALVCREWVQYTDGTDTRTETRDVSRTLAVEPSRATEAGIEAVCRLTIPVDAGAPSMDLRHNKIEWRLEQRLGHPFGRRTATRIDLEVGPVIDRNAVVGEGTNRRGTAS